jgi:hypothetical protein
VVRIARDNDGWGYTKIPDVVRLLDHETGRTTGEECLSRVIPLGERHLRHLVREYLEHYHAERPRQGLEGAIIEPANDNAGQGRMLHRKRLDGLLNHYFREAA